MIRTALHWTSKKRKPLLIGCFSSSPVSKKWPISCEAASGAKWTFRFIKRHVSVIVRVYGLTYSRQSLHHTNSNPGIGMRQRCRRGDSSIHDLVQRSVVIPRFLCHQTDLVFATSPNGYTDHELSFEWVSKVFHPATLALPRAHLVMDGHSSHLTGQLLGFCHDNNILPICLPSHTTHLTTT
jgi:hypothetical protein